MAVSMAVVDTAYCGEKTLFCYYTFIGSWFSTIFMLYKKNYGEKYLQNAPQISQSPWCAAETAKGFFFFFFLQLTYLEGIGLEAESPFI